MSGFMNIYEVVYFGAELTGPVSEKRHPIYSKLVLRAGY